MSGYQQVTTDAFTFPQEIVKRNTFLGVDCF